MLSQDWLKGWGCPQQQVWVFMLLGSPTEARNTQKQAKVNTETVEDGALYELSKELEANLASVKVRAFHKDGKKEDWIQRKQQDREEKETGFFGGLGVKVRMAQL